MPSFGRYENMCNVPLIRNSVIKDVEEDSEAWKPEANPLSNSANPMAASENLMDLVSQLSAQCRELSLQPERCK